MAAVWFLVAAAMLCWPPARPRDVDGSSVTVRPPGRRRRRRAGRTPRGDRSRVSAPFGRDRRVVALGVVAAAGLAVAVLGWPALPVAILAAPALAQGLDRAHHRAGPAADPGLPLALDLAAAALHSGQPLSRALRLGAPVAAASTAAALDRVAGLLELGTEPAAAWRGVEIVALAPVAAAGCRSADSGARLAVGFEQVAGDLRRAARATAVARGQRAGVLAMAPLGLCFLPAFICLGVVPVVVGVAAGALAGTG